MIDRNSTDWLAMSMEYGPAEPEPEPAPSEELEEQPQSGSTSIDPSGPFGRGTGRLGVKVSFLSRRQLIVSYGTEYARLFERLSPDEAARLERDAAEALATVLLGWAEISAEGDLQAERDSVRRVGAGVISRIIK